MTFLKSQIFCTLHSMPLNRRCERPIDIRTVYICKIRLSGNHTTMLNMGGLSMPEDLTQLISNIECMQVQSSYLLFEPPYNI